MDEPTRSGGVMDGLDGLIDVRSWICVISSEDPV